MSYSNTEEALAHYAQSHPETTIHPPDVDVMVKFDISERKHHGNPESAAANEKNLIGRNSQRQQVYDIIANSPNGLSMKEVSQIMGVGFNRIAGRGTELRVAGWVVRTGEIRSGSAVLKATE
jgi:hypothetical protein